MTPLDQPLRLAVGSHEAGSGKGCAMNVISWENGDTTITDFPDCADLVLAKIVQRVNDSICTHRDGDLLCPACSVDVLALGHRIVGTGNHPLTELERRRVWVRVAADQARQVAHLNTDPRVMAAIEAAEGWCDGTSTAKAAAYAYAYAAATNTYAAATYAAYAYAAATHAAGAATYAAAAATYAAATYADAAATYADAAATYAAGRAQRLALAHRAVDVWCEWAVFTPGAPDAATTAAAVRRMLEVAQ